ncbi:hypothetical protein [Spirosoma sp. KUDC1026]|uniref:hypothetical protein n=1 Tax=Spirosoma sp. KUDC1026 TaxID=2745947 RepID=UPI00159BC550|nr:hypothetical protein [Spirosoma sp. KUDC1026]QKZ14398.1 hypothetical protein HU175_17900 [Spirosoma sp. KUDC1026]
MDTFSETQRFRQWWLWALLGLASVVTIVPLVTTEARDEPVAWGGVIVLGLIGVLLYTWRLDTRLDAEGIHYRVFPVVPWRTIPWSDVNAMTVEQYSFVGYGIRLGFDGWVYNVAGNQGLRIVRNKNRVITIGTQRPYELRSFLQQHPVAH